MTAQVSGLGFVQRRIGVGDRGARTQIVASGAPVRRYAVLKMAGVGAALMGRSADATDAAAGLRRAQSPPHFRPGAGMALDVMSHHRFAMLLPEQPLRGGVVELEIIPSTSLAG